MMTVLIILTAFLIVAVYLPLVHNDFWLFKILEYPRLQKLVLVILVLGGWIVLGPHDEVWQKAMFWTLVTAGLYLVYKIWPYTIIAGKEMKNVVANGGDNTLRIFSANVYQYNQEFDRMLQQIRSTNPDVIFLLETNKAWADAVQELEKDYPYTLLAPLENTYGLLFYSRLKLENGKVAYLVKDDIPSVEALVHLPSGQKLMLWGLHPEPPVPGENLYSTAKDKELMKVALKVKNCQLPAVVFGDLNDVAWSHTTELFRKTSRLLDPRRGRGFYSTFSAHHWFIRFPLDYIFASKEFGLVKMMRMPKNGSDHFATFTQIVFQSELKHQQEAPKANKEEMEEAVEMAHQPLKE